MKKLLLLMLPILVLSCKSNPDSEEGYVNLMNGKDFSGWYLKIKNNDSVLAARVFTINDSGWVQTFASFPDSFELNTGKSYTHGLFYSEKTYSRYILRFEYKWGKKIYNNFGMFQYDAGLYYHVYDDKIWPNGIEYQIRYNHLTGENHTGDYWASATSFQWYAGENGRFLLPSEGGVPQPIKSGEHLCDAAAPYHALDENWNICEVIVMSDKYSIHKLNGKIVNMATSLSVSEGKIGFQNETAEIFYRNIRLKEFENDVPIDVFLN